MMSPPLYPSTSARASRVPRSPFQKYQAVSGLTLSPNPFRLPHFVCNVQLHRAHRRNDLATLSYSTQSPPVKARDPIACPRVHAGGTWLAEAQCHGSKSDQDERRASEPEKCVHVGLAPLVGIVHSRVDYLAPVGGRRCL